MEQYAADHDLDLAREQALAAGSERGDGWSDADRYTHIMSQLRVQLDALLVAAGAGRSGDDPAADSAGCSEAFLKGLQKFKPCAEDLEEGLKCPVCLELFVAEDRMHVLPCTHVFHPDCLLPWLRKQSTCPVCRDELPSGDPEVDAERRRRKEAAADREHELQQLHDGMFG